MAIDLMELFQAEIGLGMARQRDGAANDMRILDGVIAAALLASNDAALNTAARIPTTLSSGDASGAIDAAKKA